MPWSTQRFCSVQFSLVQFGYYFISSIIMFKVQFSGLDFVGCYFLALIIICKVQFSSQSGIISFLRSSCLKYCWFNSKIYPGISSMTSWCLPIQGAGVHVAEWGGCALHRGLNSGFP